MATTTAAFTLTSTDLITDSISLSTTATLTKAGTAVGLDQTSGIARKFYAAATTNGTLIAEADFSDTAKAHKVYVKNTSSTDTEYALLSIGSGNVALGRLYAGDWCFLPYDGTQDIDITTSDTNMTIEYMVVNEE